MSPILPNIQSPADLQRLSDAELAHVAQEIRDELVRVLSIRPAHFASNLGVVELCMALHMVYDFSKDRLIWDTGHQIYPHKLITGRHAQFDSIRTKGGLMGYPNPVESEYDLFVTGHAGCSVSTAHGLKVGDDLMGQSDRKSVAVIGDGALVSGIVFEALNNAGGMGTDLLVILNDNKMSICPRTGSLASYLDQCRMTNFYQGSKRTINKILESLPVVGGLAQSALEQLRDGLKAYFKGGMLFEEMGFRYFGPVDGHDLPNLRKLLRDLKSQKGPILLHVLTEKGHGVAQASADPVTYHTPPVFEKIGPERTIVSLKRGGSKAYTDAVSACIHQQMQDNPRVAVLTAAMCQGNKLEKVRESFPDRFFDVGICESHAVAFAAGMAKTGMRPIVDIYSTFLQRSFDQIFQEVALQNLPVMFTLDRSGVVGPDGPTHHGVFDIPYMRMFPNITVMAPGDEADVAPMMKFGLTHPGSVSMRYPKTNLETIQRTVAPVEVGKAEVIESGEDGVFIVFGTLLGDALRAAERLRQEDGLSIGVINARFCKPLDRETILRAVREMPMVFTVEEGTLEGGFGSAVLEACNSAGLNTQHIVRLGIPDRFIDHAERAEQLAEMGLDVNGFCRAVRQARAKVSQESESLDLPVA
ncbi:1-deoxy-D-xylulose-5-phosphate synthase [Tuwongella immobilis]|uniref:1-deoxy-D-xylulose-5-phosphate synthase n=1 Tax=Tuwongella immobilis TaxID=692036 RepID=A0A6C2YN18_9BACT|nr:1-deoxy-D-xylulose-5-phosphate synthase [Tuwongella immobilis]VIP02681.1 1-deoxy-d-xylulose-5-phosphate synthase : 1-deoxy-D-xylulose-5-phosphate synthase OS=Singulisphaera acidiphila (strain ATCC BAA-1392 / DSM 18658 / VKM B-2454 / MOB10) GN=dxs PE=3 SV=1: DXP_synthase_N: Transket_pyr: Transketolase_C [Tuwongella immobilis]VTS02132.1 1-deoxy-d-xylulose-5-phosphate synthase : 1-deoxy-D-xylulose-5-phosphate synthase OS=Singulisphaera acidiphila (strain ATCC BAA-1392 / DSM 18658 / VKM B-2454 / M